MTDEPSSTPRRHLLRYLAAGAAGTGATLSAGAAPAAAGNGDPVLLGNNSGNTNTASVTTRITHTFNSTNAALLVDRTSTTNNGASLFARNKGSGEGLIAQSVNGTGLVAFSDKAGTVASPAIGVDARGGTGLDSIGLRARSTNGIGVDAKSDGGDGVRASSEVGVALRAEVFAGSGRAIIANAHSTTNAVVVTNTGTGGGIRVSAPSGVVEAETTDFGTIGAPTTAVTAVANLGVGRALFALATGSPGSVAVEARGTTVDLHANGSGLIRRRAFATAAPPTSGDFKAGDLITRGGESWVCVEEGSPGQWRMLAGPASAGAFHAKDVRVFTSPGPVDTTAVSVDLSAFVPPGTNAVLLNVTAVAPAVGGIVRVFRDGLATSLPSLNFRAGGNQSNNRTTAVSADLKVAVTCTTPTDVILDLQGFYR
ncbi:hypothetical protein F0U44_14675 [Nocardioides humilatus]|uniref:Uncharacterized protein n=1 Tax=Nocardioides humilatus TaxID=2607660 RepID=A0A5B1LBQ7_9ACTN|nr:hypothetical protein [Nocardioides humilatus]KAA1417886.1 hypothetical protein F0U44_14675 [Nocardioides humilatus]